MWVALTGSLTPLGKLRASTCSEACADSVDVQLALEGQTLKDRYAMAELTDNHVWRWAMWVTLGVAAFIVTGVTTCIMHGDDQVRACVDAGHSPAVCACAYSNSGRGKIECAALKD